MTHFIRIATDDDHIPYETDIYLCSRTVAAAINAARPAGRRFQARDAVNSKWFDKFIEHTGLAYTELSFSRGRTHLDRWYVQAVY